MRDALLVPIGVLAIWTMLVLMIIPIVRARAVRSGKARIKDFRYGESPDLPGEVSLPNRHYMNLLELPVLFYAWALASMVPDKVDVWSIRLAWMFVGLRVAHSLVHLTYNNVLHRLVAFALGVTVLMVAWIKLLAGL